MLALSATLAGVSWSHAVCAQEPTGTDPGAPVVVTTKVQRYCEYLVRRHDADGDGRLSREEWAPLGDALIAADLDADGLTADELARYVASYGSGRQIRLSARTGTGNEVERVESEPAADAASERESVDVVRRRNLQYFAPVPNGTPGWFVERDLDGDAQLTLAEFSPRLRSSEVAEFKRYDLNGDGILTPGELARALSRNAEKQPGAGAP